jgi:phospholipase/carboxylesterase
VSSEQGRLTATPPGSPSRPLGPGVHLLGLAAGRDGLLSIPREIEEGRPVPLAVLFHGAGGNADQALGLLDPSGAPLAVLAPASRGVTWDFELADGADLAFVDAALQRVFEQVAVDPALLVVGGFSDGASYALSLGLGNGQLFRHIVAFSPGFLAPAAQRGRPRVFVSHGTSDAVLPVDRCGRRVVAGLRRADYDVEYLEFDGGHGVPPSVVTRAVAWLGLAGTAPADPPG